MELIDQLKDTKTVGRYVWHNTQECFCCVQFISNMFVCLTNEQQLGTELFLKVNSTINSVFWTYSNIRKNIYKIYPPG